MITNKSRIAIAVVAAVVAGIAIERFLMMEDRPVSKSPPSSQLSMVDASDVVKFIDLNAPAFRVRTASDVLPGGYSAAMVPVLIDWDRSDFSEGGEIVIRNVNDGGNPVSGLTLLRYARIRPEKVERVEFIIVPLGGPKAFSHGQLRFIFEEGGAEYIPGDDAVGDPELMSDLVLSWEAWRQPGVDFSVLKGMNSREFELTMRAYSGPQRFLEDALSKRDWTVYMLRLPGGRSGFAELLRSSLILGDGAARYSIRWMFGQVQKEWALDGPGSEAESEETASIWRELRARANSPEKSSGDRRLNLAGKTGYQTFLRSCASMALYCVDVAVARLIERGLPHEGMRPTQKPELEEEPGWMDRLGRSGVKALFVYAPRVIIFARKHPTVIPSKIPKALDEAGLLVRADGKPIKKVFSIETETPWGRRDQILIR